MTFAEYGFQLAQNATIRSSTIRLSISVPEIDRHDVEQTRIILKIAKFIVGPTC